MKDVVKTEPSIMYTFLVDALNTELCANRAAALLALICDQLLLPPYVNDHMSDKTPYVGVSPPKE